MKSILVLALSMVCLSSFAAGTKKATRQPAQSRKISSLRAVPKLDGTCLIDYSRTSGAKNEIQNLTKEQSDYLQQAVELAKKYAKESRMSDNSFHHTITAKIYDLSFGDQGAKVSLCDDSDRGQANCFDTHFVIAGCGKGAPKVSMAIEEWHTGGTDFYPVCQY